MGFARHSLSLQLWIGHLTRQVEAQPTSLFMIADGAGPTFIMMDTGEGMTPRNLEVGTEQIVQTCFVLSLGKVLSRVFSHVAAGCSWPSALVTTSSLRTTRTSEPECLYEYLESAADCCICSESPS